MEREFLWPVQYSVTGHGDLRGAIIQKVTQIFGTGLIPEESVLEKYVFYEVFDIEDASTSHTDLYASRGSGTVDYCVLKGDLYYISARSYGYAACRARFKAGSIPGISMPACRDLSPLDIAAIGVRLAFRKATFVYSGPRLQIDDLSVSSSASHYSPDYSSSFSSSSSYSPSFAGSPRLNDRYLLAYNTTEGHAMCRP
jgi:hypothetical protein